MTDTSAWETCARRAESARAGKDIPKVQFLMLTSYLTALPFQSGKNTSGNNMVIPVAMRLVDSFIFSFRGGDAFGFMGKS